MLSEELKRKIRYIQILTKKKLSGSLVGNNNTTTKGTGIDFDQIREYEQGDDVRFIHWNSSAKVNKLLVRQYFEERNRNIIIALDISSSLKFFSENLKKSDLMAQVAAILTCSGQYSKDNVGLLLFSDKVHEFIVPGQGFFHYQNMLAKIFEQKIDDNSQTNINAVFEFLIKNSKKDTIVFFISDFIDNSNFENNLKILQKKLYFIPIQCIDKNENTLPKTGIIKMRDFENAKDIFINLNKNHIDKLNNEISNMWNSQNKIFLKHSIKLLQINSQKNIFQNLIYYFKYLTMY